MSNQERKKPVRGKCLMSVYSVQFNVRKSSIEKTFVKAAACELSAKVLTGYNFGPATKGFCAVCN